jgi:anti-sigma factor RsiW
MKCEKVRNLLDRFYDNELGKRKHRAVSEHLRRCPGCAGELEKLSRAGILLKNYYRGFAESDDMSPVWAGVERAMESSEASQVDLAEPLIEKLGRIFAIPKPAWAAVTAVAIFIVLAIAYLPGDRVSTVAANDCIIDKVEAANYSVMVYETGNNGMKIIWVMNGSSEETEKDLTT